MNDKEKEIIFGYDVEALEGNVEKREEDIRKLLVLIKTGVKHPEAFQEEIKKAKKDIKNLKSYIKLIEANRSGNRI